MLQRREGYREVLQAWLNFAVAARLVWHGGEDVYGAGQRDVATLYEYWVFFKLLDLVADLFQLDQPPGRNLLEPTADGFGLKLKAGRFLALQGEAVLHGRRLRVQFSYNRSFGTKGDRAAAGSWTEPMRPDYTLSLWPADFGATEAEAQELMVHVHFDAKYRIDNLLAVLGMQASPAGADEAAVEAELSAEKQAQRAGKYKRADLLKMHAYRDAIRRSHGAYVLYPGQEVKALRGFHEVLPGLGAFALRPGGGTAALAGFLRDVVAQVCNRASAGEQHSFEVLKTYELKELAPPLYQAFPERQPGGSQRHTPPQQTWVLVGWCKSDAHLRWIRERGLYNFRMNTDRGSLALSPAVAGASYLLLHGSGGKVQTGLLRITEPQAGPRVFDRAALLATGYPGNPSQTHYLVYKVAPAEAFAGMTWNWQQMAPQPPGAATGEPFAISLLHLLESTSAPTPPKAEPDAFGQLGYPSRTERTPTTEPRLRRWSSQASPPPRPNPGPTQHRHQPHAVPDAQRLAQQQHGEANAEDGHPVGIQRGAGHAQHLQGAVPDDAAQGGGQQAGQDDQRHRLPADVRGVVHQR